MLPSKFPIKIGFDIANDPETKEAWAHPTTRTLILLWRPCHIVSQHFHKQALEIGKTIDEKKPTTVEELAKCFLWGMSDFTENDVMEFVKDALPYFMGTKRATYRIRITRPSGAAGLEE